MNRREDVCPDYGREEQTPPTIEAGGEIEIDRNVLGTGGTTGFAELRARSLQARRDAFNKYYSAIFRSETEKCETHRIRCEAFDEVIAWIDAYEADVKDETR